MHRLELVGMALVSLVTTSACGPGRLTIGEAGTGETVSTEGEDEGEGELDGWDEDIDDEDEPSDDEDELSDDEDEPSDDEGSEGLPNGASCAADSQCASQTCYVIPFIGGYCGECNSDLDCPSGGCSGPDPFATEGSVCNLGELGGGCESDDACMPGLECGIAFDLLGLITLTTCSECLSDGYCLDGQICAPLVELQDWSGARTCMSPGSLPQDAYCELDSNGDLACGSGICGVVDVMGIAQLGACGECESDADCVGTCIPGQFDLETAKLSGSICVGP
jgi:hypothetical protein